MAAVTRLGLYGGPRGPYGDFSTKEAGTPVVEDVVVPTGGWDFLMKFDRFRDRRDEDQRQLERYLEEIEELEPVAKEIAQIMQADEKKQAREIELARLEMLVSESFSNQAVKLARAYSVKVANAFVRAELQGNFSALEALEREMELVREEEMFFLMAVAILD